MRVTFTTTLSVPGQCYRRGHDYDLDDAEAARLIKAGICRATEPEPKPKAKPEKVVADKPVAPHKADKVVTSVKADRPTGTHLEG